MKPGTFQPGNTLGRNKGRFAGALRRHFAQNPEDLRLAVAQLVSKAKDGDVTALRELADRMDGKPKQSTEHTGANGSALFPVTAISVTGVEPQQVVAEALQVIAESEDSQA